MVVPFAEIHSDVAGAIECAHLISGGSERLEWCIVGTGVGVVAGRGNIDCSGGFLRYEGISDSNGANKAQYPEHTDSYQIIFSFHRGNFFVDVIHDLPFGSAVITSGGFASSIVRRSESVNCSSVLDAAQAKWDAHSSHVTYSVLSIRICKQIMSNESICVIIA